MIFKENTSEITTNVNKEYTKVSGQRNGDYSYQQLCKCARSHNQRSGWSNTLEKVAVSRPGKRNERLNKTLNDMENAKTGVLQRRGGVNEKGKCGYIMYSLDQASSGSNDRMLTTTSLDNDDDEDTV